MTKQIHNYQYLYRKLKRLLAKLFKKKPSLASLLLDKYPLGRDQLEYGDLTKLVRKKR